MSSINPSSDYHKPRVNDQDFWTQPTEEAPTLVEPKKVRGRPFVKGADARRHVHSATCGHELYQFTAEDRSNGFWSAIAIMGISIGAKLHRSGRWQGYRKGGCR